MSITPIDLWAAVRQRPALYLGEKSLSGLWWFLGGWRMALLCHQIKDKSLELPPDFHDWVAYRLGFRESASGWRNMILARNADEGEGLDTFFTLLDEHRARVPVEIAYVPEFQLSVLRSGTPLSMTGKLSLISYTLNQGFFCRLDPNPEQLLTGGFYPSLDWFETLCRCSPSDLIITDPERFAQVAHGTSSDSE